MIPKKLDVSFGYGLGEFHVDRAEGTIAHLQSNRPGYSGWIDSNHPEFRRVAEEVLPASLGDGEPIGALRIESVIFGGVRVVEARYCAGVDHPTTDPDYIYFIATDCEVV